MDQNDISAIFPTDSQANQHYIKKANQVEGLGLNEGSEEFTIESKQFPSIYFFKRPMKLLLEERSLVYDHLKIKLRPDSQKKIQQQISIEDMYSIVAQLFKQCPTPIDSVNLVFIHDCNTSYGFFSADGKFVPLCKRCNVSVYTLIRGNTFKIICCNPKCKTKILGERSFGPISVKQSVKQRKSRISKLGMQKQKNDKTKTQKQQNERVLSIQELNLIKKTVKKIYNT